MKNLLQKSLRPITIFASIIFALSIPAYFLLVEWIWVNELDENNELIAERIENEFNDQRISDEKLDQSIAFWNEIQSVGRIEPVTHPLVQDSVYTIRKQNPYSEQKDIDQFRGLITHISINNKNFTVSIETNMEESEETIAYIAVVTLLFFLILVAGLWLLNKRLSEKLWKPFQDTLQKLKSFQLSNQKHLEFEETDTIEFHELNTVLHKLIGHNITVYKMQKEFTENASHELQTPLAIIKNKLDVLLQKETVTDRQYQIIEEINRALTRASRINKNLLLLAKIENHQFDNDETVDLGQLVQQSLAQFEEHFSDRKMDVVVEIAPDMAIESNRALVEILLSNLLLNTIRHNACKGVVNVSLDRMELRIANTGTTELDKEKIFQRFTVSSSETASSGLGLAIVKEICNHYGWHISYAFEDGFHVFSVRF